MQPLAARAGWLPPLESLWDEGSPGAFLLGFAACALALGLLTARRRRQRRTAPDAQEAPAATGPVPLPLPPPRLALLAGMTQELLPPLHAILLYAELIQDHARETEDPDLRADGAALQASAQHLAALLGQLTDLGHLEAGGLELGSEFVSPEAVCLEVERIVEPLATLRGNTLALELPPHLLPIPTDRSRLLQILVSLLGEASRGAENEPLTLLVQQDASWTRFLVRGGRLELRPDQWTQLLERAEGTESLMAGPSLHPQALGLALSGRIAHLLGGHLLHPSDGSPLALELPTTRSQRVPGERANLHA